MCCYSLFLSEDTKSSLFLQQISLCSSQSTWKKLNAELIRQQMFIKHLGVEHTFKLDKNNQFDASLVLILVSRATPVCVDI